MNSVRSNRAYEIARNCFTRYFCCCLKPGSANLKGTAGVPVSFSAVESSLDQTQVLHAVAEPKETSKKPENPKGTRIVPMQVPNSNDKANSPSNSAGGETRTFL